MLHLPAHACWAALLLQALTTNHTRLLQPGLAQLADLDPPAPSTLRTAARTYQRPSINSPTKPDSPHDAKPDSILPTLSAPASLVR